MSAPAPVTLPGWRAAVDNANSLRALMRVSMQAEESRDTDMRSLVMRMISARLEVMVSHALQGLNSMLFTAFTPADTATALQSTAARMDVLEESTQLFGDCAEQDVERVQRVKQLRAQLSEKLQRDSTSAAELLHEYLQPASCTPTGIMAIVDMLGTLVTVQQLSCLLAVMRATVTPAGAVDPSLMRTFTRALPFALANQWTLHRLERLFTSGYELVERMQAGPVKAVGITWLDHINAARSPWALRNHPADKPTLTSVRYTRDVDLLSLLRTTDDTRGMRSRLQRILDTTKSTERALSAAIRNRKGVVDTTDIDATAQQQIRARLALGPLTKRWVAAKQLAAAARKEAVIEERVAGDVLARQCSPCDVGEGPVTIRMQDGQCVCTHALPVAFVVEQAHLAHKPLTRAAIGLHRQSEEKLPQPVVARVMAELRRRSMGPGCVTIISGPIHAKVAVHRTTVKHAYVPPALYVSAIHDLGANDILFAEVSTQDARVYLQVVPDTESVLTAGQVGLSVDTCTALAARPGEAVMLRLVLLPELKMLTLSAADEATRETMETLDYAHTELENQVSASDNNLFYVGMPIDVDLADGTQLHLRVESTEPRCAVRRGKADTVVPVTYVSRGQGAAPNRGLLAAEQQPPHIPAQDTALELWIRTLAAPNQTHVRKWLGTSAAARVFREAHQVATEQHGFSSQQNTLQYITDYIRRRVISGERLPAAGAGRDA